MASRPYVNPAPWPDKPAWKRGVVCVLCDRPADGYRWFGRVKMLPGRWEATCQIHRQRSGVPGDWRAEDAEYDDEGNPPVYGATAGVQPNKECP